MKEKLKKNGWKAVSEVGVSVIGSIGIVFGISWLIALGPHSEPAMRVFASYFDGGEIGLSVLSLSGAIYLMLNRIGQTHESLAIPIYLACFAPVIVAAFIVGSNPGFDPVKIGTGQLVVLGILYITVHLFWFLLLLSQPVLQTPEESGEAQESRVKGIAERAAQHGK
jgi:hypothetical protein